MGVLEVLSHIKDSEGVNDCARYIQDSTKAVPGGQTMNVIRYMQSHSLEDMDSVGYHGCSGIREVAVEQFRADAARYRATHPKRQEQVTTISVLQYLQANHKSKLPRRLLPQVSAEQSFEMSLEQAQEIWKNPAQPEEERQRAEKVLAGHTITITKTETVAEHLVLSLHASDKPTPAQLRELVDAFLAHPYFDGFKALTNIHWDRENKHCHILLCNFGANSKKLSLSGTKLRVLQRYLDVLCYERGFSVIDSKEARMDPEHAAFLDRVKAEGKVTVHPGKAQATSGKGKWKAARNRKGEQRKQEYAAAGAPQFYQTAAAEMWKKDLFLGDGVYLPWTEKTAYAMEKKKKKEAEERFYCVKTYAYVPEYHRYRHKSLLELIFDLARLIITQDAEFLRKNDPIRYEDLQRVLDSPIDYQIQRQLDSIATARELNVRSPEELDWRCKEIGAAIGETRRAIGYDEKTLEQAQTLHSAIQVWRGEHTEEEKAKAYHILASGNCKTGEQMDDLLERCDWAQRRLQENQAHLENLNRMYREAKRTAEVLRQTRARCERIHYAAMEAARQAEPSKNNGDMER